MVSRLEVAWTLGTVALIAAVGGVSVILLYHVDSLSGHPDEIVDVVGHQWYWEFCYPANHTCVNSTYDPTTNSVSGGAFWVKPNTLVQVNVTAVDVVHSFNIPALGIRLDAIPGRMNVMQFNIPGVSPGTTYLIQCTEFCGTFHGTMRSFVVVT